MADLLAQASAWLEDMRIKHASQVVKYRRGEQSIDVSASIGETVFEIDDGAGALIRVESRDYLILAKDLTLGGQASPSLPQRGDRISEGGVVYEVVPFGNEPCWRWSDPYRRTLRIHTKQVEVEGEP